MHNARTEIACNRLSAAEITVEADPATFDEDTLTALAGLGVNRLSVGVQSFSAPLLEAVGRMHTVEDVHHALSCVRHARYEETLG
eukprot:COSAG05_NODE_326_length_11360_cov_47.871781_5_plen_85_part_00